MEKCVSDPFLTHFWFQNGGHGKSQNALKRGPFMPSNSTTCPRNDAKQSEKWPRLRTAFVKLPQNQGQAASWTTWLKTKFRGHLVHLQPPTFCGFQPSKSPNETLRPAYRRSFGGTSEQPWASHSGGQRWVHQGPRGGKKKNFPKVFTCGTTGSKRAKNSCLSIPNGPRSLLEEHTCNPTLTHLWAQNGPFSRHFGILHGQKCVTTGSKWANNSCLSIPSGQGTTLEKIFFNDGGPWGTHR